MVVEQKTRGADSVMRWSCFIHYRVRKLVKMVAKQYFSKYSVFFRDEMPPYTAVTMGERWIFPQDIAAIHIYASKRS